MNLDYRKGAPPRPRKRNERRGTCAFWFLLGGLFGAFAVGIAWMRADQQAAPIAAQPAAPVEREPAPKPKFDFYSLLPQEEVVVPAERAAEPPPLPQSAPPTQTAKAVPPPPAGLPAPQASAGANSYILQVGSFRQTSDAERLKAQLAMLGIQTSIQTVTINNGQTFHRVRTGSYAKADANSIQSKLKSSGHDAMMMRAR